MILPGALSLLAAHWPWLVALLVVLHLTKNRLSGKLHHVPGPFLNSISVIPRMLSVWRGSSHVDDGALHKKYGKIVRVAPHILSVADLSAMEQIYGITTNFYKSDFWEPTRFYDEEGIIPDPLVLADKALHSRMKRNAANAYATTALLQLGPLVDGIIERLLWRLDTGFADTGKLCDMGEFLHFFSMDAIFAITFGNDLNFIEKGDATGNITKLQESISYLSTVGQAPWLHSFLKGNRYVDAIIGYLDGSSNGTLLEEIFGMAVSQRDGTLQDMSDDPNALCTFLKRLLLNQEKDPASLTDRELNTHTFGNIIAGGDTTSTALRAILANLIQYPEVADAVLAELRQAGCDRQTIVPWSIASNLPYMNAVIRESMRLHPSVGLILARAVPEGGAKIGPYQLAAGTEVGINAWILHRDPEIFPSPEEFLPERWLKADADHLAVMKRAWFAFGGGRHSCSGQHISVFEMNKLIPSLLLRFRVVWADHRPSERMKVKNHFFTLQSGMYVNLERRENNVAAEK